MTKLHNIWSILQRTCNRVRVKVRTRVRVRVRVRVSFRVRVGLGLHNWPNAQIDQMRLLLDGAIAAVNTAAVSVQK